MKNTLKIIKGIRNIFIFKSVAIFLFKTKKETIAIKKAPNNFGALKVCIKKELKPATIMRKLINKKELEIKKIIFLIKGFENLEFIYPE